MPKYRSDTTTVGNNMSGARSLWRATGVTDNDFGKPFIAVVNSFTQFVPGHIHLSNVGKIVAKEIEFSGGIAKEFNTIAIDDGIAMGHNGMLYSLPSRELIADSIEYMVNAHCVDAMVCISNCDKITPGMLIAALRLNIPVIFVSGGPMEAGKIKISNNNNNINNNIDLIDSIMYGVKNDISNENKKSIEKNACPTCGSCSGMFTANSMNCLTEALGLSFPGNGTLLATHIYRKKLFIKAGKLIVYLTKSYYKDNNKTVLPRNIACKSSFENAMILDLAMGGSTNTVLHLLAAAQEAKINFSLADINLLSKKVPYLCKVSPNTNKYHIEDVHRAGGVIAILGELYRSKKNLLNLEVSNILGLSLLETIFKYDIFITKYKNIKKMYLAGPGGIKTIKAFSQNFYWESLDIDRKKGCIRSYKFAYHYDGGLAVLFGNLAKDGCVVKTAGIDSNNFKFNGIAKVYESQEDASNGIINGEIVAGNIVVIKYEGPKGGPGMQEMLYPTTFLKSMNLNKSCALITDGRFSGGTSGISIGHISPEAAAGGLIALVKDGDLIKIDIINRNITLQISEDELSKRYKLELSRGLKAWTPLNRKRKISFSLKAYAYFATSADKGAVRDIYKL